MSDLGNKEVFSRNLRKFIELNGKDRKDIAEELLGLKKEFLIVFNSLKVAIYQHCVSKIVFYSFYKLISNWLIFG